MIGVVSSKLNALVVGAAKNDIPQNINFAIKASVAMAFMSTNGVEPTISSKATPIDQVDIAKSAESYTINIRCEFKGES